MDVRRKISVSPAYTDLSEVHLNTKRGITNNRQEPNGEPGFSIRGGEEKMSHFQEEKQGGGILKWINQTPQREITGKPENSKE